MEIKPTTSPDASRNVSSGESKPGRGTANPPAAAASPPADKLSLTSPAKALLTLHTDAQEAPFDAERVATLRQAIADGSYRPDFARTAAGLIGMETG